MAKLPRPSGKEMLRFLLRRGYSIVRISGSHHIMDDGVHRTSVPVHGERVLKIGTLSGILRDIDMRPAEFEQAWHE